MLKVTPEVPESPATLSCDSQIARQPAGLSAEAMLLLSDNSPAEFPLSGDRLLS